MDENELKKERFKLLRRINEINALLNQDKNDCHLSIEEVALKVREVTGIEVKNIGSRCKKEGKIAKQLFWRAGYNQCISGTNLSSYTGDKSRFAAFMGKRYHINNCAYDPLLRLQWNQLKKLINQ